MQKQEDKATGLESTLPAYLSTLNAAWPLGTDKRATADDHLQYFKRAVQTQFAGLAGTFTAANSITATVGRWNDVFTNAVLLNADTTFSAGATIVNTTFQSYREKFVDKGTVSTSASVTLDFSAANNYALTVGKATLTMTFSGWATSGFLCTLSLEVTQDSTGSRDLIWPSSVKWSGGVKPPISQSAGTVSSFVFKTHDAGTTIKGYQIGFNES